MPDLTLLAFAWPFVHPGLAAAGAAAALIPLLIHLINRRRFQKMPWAAMAFLVAANRRSARRVRLEQFLLLLTRMVLLIFLGLAIARPFVSDAVSSPLGLASARAYRVVILDNTLSMQAAGPDGRTRFDAAMSAAQKLLSLFPAGDAISLVTTAQPAEVLIGSPTNDRRMAKEILSGVRATQQSDDVVAAMESVRQMLLACDFPPNNRSVYLISDFAEVAWHVSSQAGPSAAVQKLADLGEALGHRESCIHLIRVDSGSNENLAITDFRPESTLLSIQMPVSMVVDIHNFGPSTVRGANLLLRSGTQTIRRESLPAIGPGMTNSTVMTAPVSAPGVQRFEVRVTASTPDALSLDDSRWLSLEFRDQIPVLIVDGAPGARLIDGQAGYLATALAPRDPLSVAESAGWSRSAGNIYDVKVVSEPELRSEIMSTYDVIVLCNVHELPVAQWNALEAYARNGGGVLFALGSLVLPDHYNQFGFDEGKGLLPAKLERVHEVSGQGTRTGFDLGGQANGLLADFVAHHSSGLFSARVERYFALGLIQPSAEIPLYYTDLSPALVTGQHGRGRVAIWTTSINMEWNNLPGRGDFVAVMMKVIGSLLPQPGQHRNLQVGQTLREALAPAESSMPLKVLRSEGQSATPDIVPGGDGLAAEFGPILSAGPLDLSIGQRRLEFAVNPDTSESALQPANETAISGLLGKSIQWLQEDQLPAPSAAKSVELASALFWFVLGMLLLELWLAQYFSRVHPARGSAATLRHFLRRQTSSAPGVAVP